MLHPVAIVHQYNAHCVYRVQYTRVHRAACPHCAHPRQNNKFCQSWNFSFRSLSMWNDIKRDILLQFRINLALAALVCSLPRVCVCVADATRCEKQRVYSFVLCKYTKNSMFDVERIWGEGEYQRCLLWYAIHIYAAEWSVLGMPKRPFHTKNFVFVCVFEWAPRFAIYFWLLLTDAMCALANTINDCTYNRFYCVKFHLLSFVFLISLFLSLCSVLCTTNSNYTQTHRCCHSTCNDGALYSG